VSGSKINIRAVAQKAGVSITTVSRVVNNSPIPTSDTRSRVMEVVRELNYQPDPIFRQAFRRRPGIGGERVLTRTIGYFTTEGYLERALHDDGYYSRVLAGIQKGSRQNRYHVMLASAEADAVVLPEMVADHRVDGLLVEGNFSDTLRRLLVQRLPVVFVDRSFAELSASSVMPNVERAVHEELEYLWELGHRNIVCFQPVPNAVQYDSYQRAFQQFFAEKNHRLPQAGLCEPREITTPTHEQVMAEYARQFVAARPMPTALAAYDVYARTLTDEFRRLGVHVPEDVSVIGMDDTAHARHGHPQLSSYRFPLDDMGRTAVELLVQRIEDRSRPVHHVLVNGQMVERASCASPSTKSESISQPNK
jgi:LacI family transcriptional regulator